MATDLVQSVSAVEPRRRNRPTAGFYQFFVPLCLIVLAAFLVPLFSPMDLAATDLRTRLLPPVFLGGIWEHPLGTDQLGRDLGMLMIYGTRESLTIALAGVVIASAIGLLLGLGAGFWGGRIDTITMFFVDARLSLPGIVITTAAVAFLGSSALSLILIIGFTGWAGFARIVRSEMLTLREMTFITVSRPIGASPWRIIREHALVNMGSVVIVNFALQLVGFIMLESSLSFLGLGIQPPGASLGLLVAEGREYLLDAWWLAIFPSVIIAVIAFLVTMTGDWLRDRLDPRTAVNRKLSKPRKKGMQP